MTEQSKAERQKEKVTLQLRRTESVSTMSAVYMRHTYIVTQDMIDVKEQLLKMKQENHTLEAELRGTYRRNNGGT